MVSVKRIDPDTYEVEVQGKITTTHRVTAGAETCRRLAGSSVDPERVIVESFRFLLEREPNTSILSSFELSVIGRYFPEYESELRQRLATR
jgi:hypothetical protein